MLRRSLPVAAFAAAAVLVPGTAAAAPSQAPVHNVFRAEYSTGGTTVLPDGRHASVNLDEIRGASQDGWTASFGITTWTERECGPYTCYDDYMTGTVSLDAGDVDFARNLSGAQATDIPVTLQQWAWNWPGGRTLVAEEDLVVSLRFTATGELDRSTYHGDMCSDGACQTMRIQEQRAGLITVTVDGETVTADATISHIHAVEAAVKPLEEGSGN